METGARRSIAPRGAAFVLALAGAAASFCAEAPRLEPDPRALSFAAAGSSPAWSEAIDLALWASGSSGASAEQAASSLRASVSAFVVGIDPTLSRGERAELALAAVHRNHLKRYSERQTLFDVLLSSGTYNCVSSAALYYVYASAAGLDVEGVQTPDHAFCSVQVDGRRVDVETTNPYGYDPGTKKEFHDSFGRVTGFAYADPSNYRSRRAVPPIELLSLILSNRIAAAEASGRFADAVGFAVDRFALARGGAGEEKARSELIGRLANFGAGLLRSGKEEEALSWVDRCEERYGADPRLAELRAAAANNLVASLTSAKRWTQARAVLERYASAFDAKAYAALSRSVGDSELASAALAASDAAEAEALFSALSSAVASGVMSVARARELADFAALKEAERRSRSAGFLAAAAYLEGTAASGAGFAPGFGPNVARGAKNYRDNYVAEIHNAFARLFNAGRKEEARAKLEEGLRSLPGDARLEADLEILDKAEAR